MPTIAANGITIAYEDHGDPTAPPILLVMGLGRQLTSWPIELVEALVARGFRVIRYDNRDTGLSTRFEGTTAPGIRSLLLRSLFRLPVTVPYRIADMARDAVGLLDALGIDRAHIVGASMGGMIAQHVAASHASRAASMVSIMSTTGNPWLPRAKPEAMRVLTGRPASADIEAQVAFTMQAARVIGSPGYPPDPARLEVRVRAEHVRGHYPAGIARHIAAIVADGDRRAMLKRIRVPSLVIHGDADPLVPVTGGQDTAKTIPDARLTIIPGMGHDLPLALVDTMADAIAGHARSVAVLV
jgi:pimeloyl-ACP methyl ester carboxylesterase